MGDAHTCWVYSFLSKENWVPRQPGQWLISAGQHQPQEAAWGPGPCAGGDKSSLSIFLSFFFFFNLHFRD